MSNFSVLDKRSYPVLKYVVKIGSFFNVEYSFKSVYNSSYKIISSSHTAIFIISPPFAFNYNIELLKYQVKFYNKITLKLPLAPNL